MNSTLDNLKESKMRKPVKARQCTIGLEPTNEEAIMNPEPVLEKHGPRPSYTT